MPKTVLIILAAVVALIVIVVLTGMRYLRADDEDDFDDDGHAEHGRVHGHSNHKPQERARPRHDDELAEERPSQRQAERVGAGRAALGRGARDGRGEDRSWQDGDSRDSRPGRAALPQRVAAGSGSRGARDEADGPPSMPAGYGRGQSGRRPERGPEDFDGRPSRMPAMSRGYDRDVPDRRDSADRRDRREFGDSRDSERRDSRDSRAPVGPRDTDSGSRDDRRGSTRQNSKPDGRRVSSQPDREESLPSVRPRQSKKRDDDGDWPSNDWDDMSDVDYWAELASDKPLTTTGPQQELPTRGERGESRRNGERAPRADRPASSPGQDLQPQRKPGSRPGRPSDQPGPGRGSDFGGRGDDFAGKGPRRIPAAGGEPPAALPAARSSRNGSRPVLPPVDDDDPLTSPSFPRIEADDSRSYRRSRSTQASSRSSGVRAADAGDSQPRTQQYPSYPSMPSGQPLRGLEARSQPNSYPRTPAAAASDHAGAPADPYRSVPTATSAPHGYPVPAAVTANGYQALESASGSYATAGPAGSGSYPGPASAPSYQPGVPPGSSSGYPAQAGSGSYSVPSGTGSYPTPAVPSGYPTPPVPPGGGYRSDPYSAANHSVPNHPVASHPVPGPDSGSYPVPAPVGGYPTQSGTGGYQAAMSGYPVPPAAGYPGPAASYDGFSSASQTSGPHMRPDASYTYAADYPPSGQHAPYPAYQAPAQGSAAPLPPAGSGGPPGGFGGDVPVGAAFPSASVPSGVLPGWPDPRYQPHEVPGYPSPAPAANGYAGADPYAMDPYGYTGYGTGGF